MRIVTRMRGCSYIRLKTLLSLEKRRLKGDLMGIHKMMRGLDIVDSCCSLGRKKELRMT